MRRLVPALLAAAALLLAGCGAGGPVPAGGDGQGYVSGDGSVSVIPAADRQPAPALSGKTLDGTSSALSDYSGDVVVLNVWASWCGPCRAEAPYLRAVYHDTKRLGVQFLGINTRDDVAAAQAFERRFDITYPSLVDDGGQLMLEFGQTLPPSSIPSTLVIDRQGRIAARVLGETTYTQLSGLVKQVAAESAS